MRARLKACDIMKFIKMQGCGNDYVYIDCLEQSLENESEAAIKLSNRHFGVGADGLILIKKGSAADFEMVMYNADGSRAEMCGNGIRCVARYVYDKGYTDSSEFTVESMGKVKNIRLVLNGAEVKAVRVDMGAPVLHAAEVPVISQTDKVINSPVQIGGRDFNMTCVSMGNPHAVMFIAESPRDFALESFGPLFESSKLFPNRVNAEFARIISDKEIEMRVWERGTGETLACGTGACATAVAARLCGYTGDEVVLHLVGGDLKIEWNGREDSPVYMTGPAEYAFTGDIDIDKIRRFNI